MAVEYRFEFYPYGIFKEEMVGEHRKIFSCKAEKECRVEDVHPEFSHLVEMFQDRDEAGWEVAQIFFQENGVLVFYKRRKE